MGLRSPNEETVLHLAARRASREMVELLLEHPAVDTWGHCFEGVGSPPVCFEGSSGAAGSLERRQGNRYRRCTVREAHDLLIGHSSIGPGICTV